MACLAANPTFAPNYLRMFRFLISMLFLSTALTASAQTDRFFPRNLQRAYDKGTRSADGKPGPNYWQNRAAYTIKASLDPLKHRLSGEAVITYINNSPDSLKILRLKLAHDLYKKGGQRASEVNPNDVDEGVQIEALTYNGQAVAEKQRRRHNTFLDIQLAGNALGSGATATVTVKWSYTLPSDKQATRECVCDAGSFFVSYWYPQVAVYDDLRGWADAPYNGL